MKRLVILGSTGTIGEAALDVVRRAGAMFQVVGLSAGTSGEKLARQVREFTPECVAMLHGGRSGFDAHARPPLPEVLFGDDGLVELVSRTKPDIVLVAIAGVAALRPALAAARLAKRVALANKECLVAGGRLLLDEAGRSGCELLPVDSEHSAAFQLLEGIALSDVKRLVLTASGGPFRGWPMDRLTDVTPAMALAHPVWRMGAKITIDSATFMNKALELVEAAWLFGLEFARLGVVVHPQSMVHALVECVDGAVLAHLGKPDMRFPIRYALTYPERSPGGVEFLDVAAAGRIEFEPPDARMQCVVDLAGRVIGAGGTAGAVMNAANEVAVDEFLSGNLPFAGIVPLVEQVCGAIEAREFDGLSDLLRADTEARSEAKRCLQLSTR